MTSGSPTVTVTHNSHGAGVGDFVTFDSFSTAQGLDMNNEFEVTSVVDGNNYTVTHTSNASGTASSQGGSGNAKYQITVGTDRSAFGFGWGTGAWIQPRQNIGGGSGLNRPGLTTTIALEATYWMFDTFGEVLLAIRNDDALYKWDLSAGTGTRAQKVTQAPGKN